MPVKHTPLRAILIPFLLLLAVSASGLLPGRAEAAIPRRFVNTTPIQHIVFIEKENHTFDSMFGGYACLDGAGNRPVPCVNGAASGQIKVNGTVSTIALSPASDQLPNVCHQWACAHSAADSGKMDHFNTGPCKSAPYPCYVMGTASLAPNYWSYADHYVLDDNAFSSEEAASFANHLFMLAAASGADQADSVLTNPVVGGKNERLWGCDAPTGTTVKLYNGSTVYPCFDGAAGDGKNFPTLADEMTASGLSWRYYTVTNPATRGYNWDTPDAFPSIRASSGVVPWTQFAADAASGTLPAFSWLTAPQAQSEHPPASTCAGENWTVQQINAVMAGPDWASTVIIVTWDDYGGLYDHVPPPTIDGLGYGFRVPFLVISPFARATDNPTQPNISHDQLSFESVLKLAEEVYGLPALTARDANAGDLMPLLDFTANDPPLPLSQRSCPAQTMPLNGDWND